MFGRRLIAQRGGVFAAMVAVNPGHRRRPPVSLPPVGRSRRWPREAGGAPHAWENRAVPLPGLLAIAGLIVWVGYELVLRRSGDTDTASWQGGSQDQSSTRLLLAAYAVALAVNVTLSLASVGMVQTAWRWVGVAVLAVGLSLRAWGMTTLGACYTRTLRTVGDQRLVQDGPYRLIRHPGYSGSLLVWAGYSLGLGSWIALVVTAGLLLAVYSWRINAEESMLLSTFGEQYAQYRRRTKRLIPFLY